MNHPALRSTTVSRHTKLSNSKFFYMVPGKVLFNHSCCGEAFLIRHLAFCIDPMSKPECHGESSDFISPFGGEAVLLNK